MGTERVLESQWAISIKTGVEKLLDDIYMLKAVDVGDGLIVSVLPDNFPARGSKGYAVWNLLPNDIISWLKENQAGRAAWLACSPWGKSCSFPLW